MLLHCGVGENSWESLGLQGDPASPSWRKSVLNIHWKDWCWSWNFNVLATWCERLTHLRKPWCLERLKVGGEGDNRVWDGWMALPMRWMWVWVNSGNCWWTRHPGMLQSMGSQRVGHDWATELNWSCTPRPNLLVTPDVSLLPTFAFQSPVMKRTSFLGFVLEGLVCLHRTFQLQLLQHY